MAAFIIVIRTLFDILTLLIIADALMSFILSPMHPIREALGRILNPIYAPVRRIVPPMGMMDFTPLVVLILIRVIEMILFSMIR